MCSSVPLVSVDHLGSTQTAVFGQISARPLVWPGGEVDKQYSRILRRHFLNYSSFLSDDSSLCHGNIQLASIGCSGAKTLHNDISMMCKQKEMELMGDPNDVIQETL